MYEMWSPAFFLPNQFQSELEVASRQRVFPLVQLISAGGWLRLEIEILRL